MPAPFGVSVEAMKRLQLLRATVADPKPAYPPSHKRRPRHALVSGERKTLCGETVAGITPGTFDPNEAIVCRTCRALAVRLVGTSAAATFDVTG